MLVNFLDSRENETVEVFSLAKVKYLRDGPLEKLWGGRGIFEPQEFFFVIKFLV